MEEPFVVFLIQSGSYDHIVSGLNDSCCHVPAAPRLCLLAASRLPFRKHCSAFFYLEGFEVVNNRNNEDKNRLLLVFQHRD